MEPITTATIALAFGKGLSFVWPIMVEKGIEKGLVEPSVKPVGARVNKLVEQPLQKRALQKAFEAALADAGAPTDDDTALDRWLKNVSLDRLVAKQNDALRRQFARAVVGFTDPKADPPVDLLVALDWPRPQQKQLSALLASLRAQLYELETWRPLIDYANEMAKVEALPGILATMARLDNVFVETERGEALRVIVQEKGLSQEDAARIEENYRAELVRKLWKHKFKGISQFKRTLRLPLADIYHELKLIALNDEDEHRHERWQVQRLSEKERAALQEKRMERRTSDALARSQRLVILGDPGTGKTTSLNFTTLMLAYGYGAARLNLDAPYIPIKVRLADYADELKTNSSLSLDNFIFQIYSKKTASTISLDEYLRYALETGGCLMLLDGLDEVGDDPQGDVLMRAKIVQNVQDFADGWCTDRSNRIVVSSRIEGYWDGPLADFDHAELSPLQFPDEVRDFLLHWFSAYEQAQNAELSPEQASVQAQKLVDAMMVEIEASESVQRLAANPLLLTILVLIHENVGKLPHRRAQLYETATKTLIESWRGAQTDRRTGLRDMDGEEIGNEVVVRVVAELAYRLHQEQPDGTAPLKVWRERLTDILEEDYEEDAPVITERFLKHIRLESGLLVERGLGKYGFFHLTFEEYLTAKHIALQTVEDRRGIIEKYWTSPNWREVFLLVAGHLGIVDTSQPQASLYIDSLLNLEPSPEHTGRQVVLAGRAVADIGMSSIKKATRILLRDMLAKTMRDEDLESGVPHKPPLVPVRTRFDAGLILDELRWLPPDLNKWIEVRSKPRLRLTFSATTTNLYAMKYPVTNAQFERFIVAKGYENQAWWSDDGWKWRTEEYDREWRGEDAVTEPEYWQTAQYGQDRRGFPVVGVSWYEAEAYANWLKDVLRRASANDPDLPPQDLALVQELLTANATKIRLPTHDEWRMMAGGVANEDRYPWDPPQGSATSKEVDIIARCNTSESDIRTTSPVAMYPLGASKPFEIMDLGGNVWEWTDTIYENISDDRVRCGGSWFGDRGFARPSAHLSFGRYGSYYYFGFRLVSPIDF